MCGRLNVTDDPLARVVSQLVGIDFFPQMNLDLKPTENVSVVAFEAKACCQKDIKWGTRPEWAKRLIINAQSETVASKPTFRNGFVRRRVIVPCNGWYEWCESGGKKNKFLFTNPDGMPLYMAGILTDDGNLVTLTTSPNIQCLPYHHRMPFLVPDIGVEQWLTATPQQAQSYLELGWSDELLITAV
ncbi:SOS response-associated peptidase [Vibrio coralliilyticus]|uniref:SOS response-associated peptidase n=1 Tax=Vibrio coralliilyticus TaxID=190893 RepID=UPI0015610150|nr:SOS response-associated peptidase family protein [Vibrio coralliilyticus]NRF64232.1 SOS response-associated peptidase family protein [Vibrio coralliilyticus]